MSILTKDDLNPSGGGLNAFTRIAGANPDLWWAIFSMNETELTKALDDFQIAFSNLRDAILKKDQQAALKIMNAAYILRKSL